MFVNNAGLTCNSTVARAINRRNQACELLAVSRTNLNDRWLDADLTVVVYVRI
jgi:hypothetical protein